MKILILLKTYHGGTGTFVKDLEGIAKLDKSVKIQTISLEKPDKGSIFYKDSFTRQSHYPEKYSLSFGLILTLIRELLWLRQTINKCIPDIVLTVDAHCLVLSYLEKVIFSEKYQIIATIHNNLERVIYHKTPKALIGIVKKAISYCLNNISFVITISNKLADNLTSFFKLKKRPEVIYYGLSDLRFTDKGKKWKAEREKTIVTLSRLVPQKDLITLISAFQIVKRKHPKIKLIIGGDGPLRESLEKFIYQEKIQDITFKGWIEEPMSLMEHTDIFVFSSNWEGFGYVIIEAMSLGLPVISTDTPYGPSEILLNGKYGILVPMKNANKMADALLNILENKDQYEKYSRMSINRSKDFTLTIMQTEYLNCIRSIAKMHS